MQDYMIVPDTLHKRLDVESIWVNEAIKKVICAKNSRFVNEK